MTELRQRMLDAMVQRGFAARTQETYIRAVMACGVLSQDGKWLTPARKPDFLFPVHALSKVFRGKFLAALAQGHKGEQLGRDPQGEMRLGVSASAGRSQSSKANCFVPGSAMRGRGKNRGRRFDGCSLGAGEPRARRVGARLPW